MIKVGNVNLPVLRNYYAKHVPASDANVRERNGRPDTSGAVAKAIRFAPFAVVDELNRDAGSTEQAGTGFGDVLQRPCSVPRSARDRAQDFGAAGLLVPGCLQFSLKLGVFPLEID